MKKKDPAIELVHSLSKPEKRFFKIHTARYKTSREKNYLRLFHAIENIENADTLELKRKLKDPLLLKNLPVEKHHLNDLILDSLRELHADNFSYSRLNKQLQNAFILRNKGLYTQAIRFARKVREEAAANELFELQLQALGLEQELLVFVHPNGLDEAAQLIGERKRILAVMQNIAQLESLHVRTSNIYKLSGYPKNKADQRTYAQLKEELDALEDPNAGASERSIFLRAKAHLLASMHDYEASFECNEEQRRVYETNPALIEKRPSNYVLLLFFHAQHSGRLGRINTALECIAQLRRLRTRYTGPMHQNVAEHIERILLPLMIYVNSKAGRHQEVVRLESKAAAFIQKHSPSLYASSRNAMLYNIALNHYLMGSRRNAIRTTFRSISFSNCKDEYETYYMTVLLKIIAHLDLHDEEVAESLIRSLKRFVLQRKEDPKIFDHVFLNLLSQYIEQEDETKRLHLLRGFIAKNEAQMKQLMETMVFIPRWLKDLGV